MKAEQGHKTGKRTAALLMTVLMLLTAVSGGCAAKEEAETPNPVTFTFYNADGAEDPWTDPVAQAITKATGVTLKTDYPIDGANSKILQMIASSEYPDIIYAKGDTVALIEAEALLDLTDLIEEYGPNIKKLYGESYGRLKHSEEDPSIYQLASDAVGQEVYTTSGSVQLQWDVVKYNNYEIPYTLAEYEEQIKNYMSVFPAINGKKTLGLSISCSDWRWYITLSNPSGFVNGYPDNGQWVVDDANDFATCYKHASEGQYEYYKWLNRMYEEGVLDAEFATQRHEDYMQKITEGRVLGLLDAEWDYDEAELILQAAGKYERTYVGLPVTMDESIPCAALYDRGVLGGWGIAITKSCADPVRAIQFIDYLCSDEGQVLIQWGIENVNYLIGADGKRYVPEDEVYEKQTDSSYVSRTGVGKHAYPFPHYGAGVTDANGDYYTPSNRQAVIDAYNMEEKAAVEAWGVELLTDIFPSAESFGGISPYGAVYSWARPSNVLEVEERLDEISARELVNVIICGQENFDAKWEEFQKMLEEAGLEEVNRRMTELVQSRVRFWSVK